MMAGKPYESQLTWGYDNARKKFFIIGIDNMGSGILNTEGTYDAASRVFTFYREKNGSGHRRRQCPERDQNAGRHNTQFVEMYRPDKDPASGSRSWRSRTSGSVRPDRLLPSTGKSGLLPLPILQLIQKSRPCFLGLPCPVIFQAEIIPSAHGWDTSLSYHKYLC